MAEPLREQVLVEIARTLRTISRANGFHTDVKVVTRTFREAHEHTEFPVLTVVEANGSLLIRCMQDLFDHHLIVRLYGYVKGDDQEIRSTRLERLLADVRTLLIRRARLGGLVRDIVLPERGLETDEAAWEPLGVFAQDVEVIFQETIPGE